MNTEIPKGLKTHPNDSIQPVSKEVDVPHTDMSVNVQTTGLTKREFFAGQFAIGFAAAGGNGMPAAAELADYIVNATDALIEKLNANL